MHIKHALAHSASGRWRLIVAMVMLTFCVTVAIAIGGPVSAEAATSAFATSSHDMKDLQNIGDQRSNKLTRVGVEAPSQRPLHAAGRTPAFRAAVQTPYVVWVENQSSINTYEVKLYWAQYDKAG